MNTQTRHWQVLRLSTIWTVDSTILVVMNLSHKPFGRAPIHREAESSRTKISAFTTIVSL